MPAEPPPSFYAAKAGRTPSWPQLEGARRADVAIVGGGFTGLSAALALAERGREVVLLEAGAIASGATGRNGGQLHTGQRRDQIWLERTVGPDVARALWDLDREAHALVHDLRGRFAIDCHWRPGVITAAHRPARAEEEWRYAEHLATRYGYDALKPLSATELAAAIGTQRYHGGLRDGGGGHLDPYCFALGLAAAATAAGAAMFEASRVRAVREDGGGAHGPRWRVETDRGEVRCNDVIIAANGLLGALLPAIAARVMPLDNYAAVTEPLPDALFDSLIPGGEAVSDTRVVVRYWRPTPDRRLLFGGGETFSRRPKRDPAAFVRPYLTEVYPQLADVAIEHAWGGTLAITRYRCPLIDEIMPGLFTGCGYSGHGVGTATFAGKVIADAICGDRAVLETFARLPVPPFPGGHALRAPMLAAAMAWGALSDRL